jgi:hypothetical protein
MKHVSDDSRLQQKILKAVKTMSTSPHVQVGILQDKERKNGFSMTALAAVHEYGSSDGHIPARSFIRSPCDAQEKKHVELIKKLEDKVLKGQLTIKQALTTLGEVIAKDMVQSINKGINPSLKAATIKRKKSSKPLIDKGLLRGAITHEVRNVA